MIIKEAIILAGGIGTRMQNITMDKYPKALIEIGGKSIIEWEIEWLAREGVTHVIPAIGHLGQLIEERIGNGISTKFGDIKVTYSLEEKKLGSGGAFKLASQYIETERCFVINGDILCNGKLQEMIKLHKSSNTLATMFLVNMISPYGIVENDKNMITKFVEKPILPYYIHSGIDIIEREVFYRFPDIGQMEETVFVELANENKFAAYQADEGIYWQSIDSKKDFDNANKIWNGV